MCNPLTTKSPIRVMLVDDHKVVRCGLAIFLTAHDDFQLVAEAADGVAAIGLCASEHPDVILMDLLMPRMDGTTATRIIHERYPNIHILILTNFNEENLVFEALKAGALGYLLKNVTPDELASAIRLACRQRGTFAPEAAAALVRAALNDSPTTVGNDLTCREREVLSLMAEGMDNKRIAETLIVSNSTVKFHVSNILAKLHKENRTEAVVVAYQHHLIHPIVGEDIHASVDVAQLMESV